MATRREQPDGPGSPDLCQGIIIFVTLGPSPCRGSNPHRTGCSPSNNIFLERKINLKNKKKLSISSPQLPRRAGRNARLPSKAHSSPSPSPRAPRGPLLLRRRAHLQWPDTKRSWRWNWRPSSPSTAAIASSSSGIPPGSTSASCPAPPTSLRNRSPPSLLFNALFSLRFRFAGRERAFPSVDESSFVLPLFSWQFVEAVIGISPGPQVINFFCVVSID